MYDYVWLCMTMYDYLWLCMTLYLTIYDYVWLCITIYDYVWLYMTMYNFEGERKRKRERAILTTFSSFCKCFQTMKLFSDNSHSFPWFKCFKAFHTFQQTLPLFTFVYVCLPLFTFVNLCLPVFNWRIYACFCIFGGQTDRRRTDRSTNR